MSCFSPLDGTWQGWIQDQAKPRAEIYMKVLQLDYQSMLFHCLGDLPLICLARPRAAARLARLLCLPLVLGTLCPPYLGLRTYLVHEVDSSSC
jgi:hypothetical protein